MAFTSLANVKLTPSILANSQKYVSEKYNVPHNTLNFVFHGGSGSSAEEISESISYGVIKINIDTDTQWASWEGIMQFYKKNEGYLQGQIGNQKAMTSLTRNTMIVCGNVQVSSVWLLVWNKRLLI